MKHNMFVPALLLTLIFSLSPVAASLIDSNDLTLPSYLSADGLNITTDTLTNLDWLDIDTTTNISFIEMSALLGVGELRDFRYATLSEIDTFFNHLGLPTVPLPAGLETNPGGAALALAASSHTGQTDTAIPDVYAAGLIADPTFPQFVGVAEYRTLAVVLRPDSLLTNAYEFPPSGMAPNVGSWIVRPANGVIPEPSSVVVWGLLGALGLAVPGWRRRFGSQS